MSKLSLQATAIGSLPYDNQPEATKLVWDTFEIPFWAQLSNVNPMEDMIIQYSENIPGMYIDTENQIFGFDGESEAFYTDLEEFYLDYDEITTENNTEKLDKYGLKAPYSSTFKPYIDLIKEKKPQYVKCHITGPFTWGTSISDNDKKCLFYDETYRDIIVKALTLKSLWQIEQIKKVSPNTTPIIFMDEPTMSQVGTSAFITVKETEIIDSIKQISDILKAKGALTAIHCCGKADWGMLLKSGIKILNFDAYSFTKNLTVYSDEIKTFLVDGGIIAWGIVPTLDVEALTQATKDSLIEKLEEGFDALSSKGIEKELIVKQSLITPSCGAGCLNAELAEKAMLMTKGISDTLIKRYDEVI
ncbi:MAG: hypothetical protein PHV37_06120 [Candidatus Gastranaerophilales bacterium]|nr:hypothetical protein [Candidatus Gastranaerophilales bacterium]